MLIIFGFMGRRGSLACATFFMLTMNAQWVDASVQRSISLPEALQMAEQNSALQRDLAQLRRSAELKLRQVSMEKWLSTVELTVFGGVVPDVNADAAVSAQSADDLLFNVSSNEVNDGFSFSKLGPFARAELKVIQPLFTFGKISGFEDMATENLQLSEAERRREIDRVRATVKRAYYTYQLSQDALSILEEVRKKLADAEEKVEELLIQGSEHVEENDRLKIRVFQADVENRSLDAVRGLRLARSSLAELAGLQGEWRPYPDTLTAEVVEGVEHEQVISQVLRAQPDLQRLRHFIQIKEAERRSSRGSLFPDFFVAGELHYAVAPGRTDIKSPYLNDPFNNFGFGVALGLRQDLGIHRTLNRMDQFSSEILRLQAQRERLESVLRLRAEEAFQRALMAQRGIEINKSGFRAARSWLTSTGLAFSLGTVPTKDVLESYAAYFKARVDLIRSIYELNIALSELSQAVGIEYVERLQTP